MNIYLTRHQYKNTFTEDLWAALEEPSKKPVRAVMSSWTKQMGFPVIRVTASEQDGDSRILTVTQEKFVADNSECKISHAEGGAKFADNRSCPGRALPPSWRGSEPFRTCRSSLTALMIYFTFQPTTGSGWCRSHSPSRAGKRKSAILRCSRPGLPKRVGQIEPRHQRRIPSPIPAEPSGSADPGYRRQIAPAARPSWNRRRFVRPCQSRPSQLSPGAQSPRRDEERRQLHGVEHHRQLHEQVEKPHLEHGLFGRVQQIRTLPVQADRPETRLGPQAERRPHGYAATFFCECPAGLVWRPRDHRRGQEEIRRSPVRRKRHSRRSASRRLPERDFVRRRRYVQHDDQGRSQIAGQSVRDGFHRHDETGPRASLGIRPHQLDRPFAAIRGRLPAEPSRQKLHGELRLRRDGLLDRRILQERRMFVCDAEHPTVGGVDPPQRFVAQQGQGSNQGIPRQFQIRLNICAYEFLAICHPLGSLALS
ncbi:unnamed protein product [Nesidiocoris tenuis]|uniref:Peptidase M1 membrane alanine aminopeptidase domain-containing protein n=1 Tax=Nesidiocoris tenuis TaxID=355587 RepID=A0A6H5GMS7_9HEMI|nr:unnamed protein product [Nesidiocoris tenuis]